MSQCAVFTFHEMFCCQKDRPSHETPEWEVMYTCPTRRMKDAVSRKIVFSSMLRVFTGSSHHSRHPKYWHYQEHSYKQFHSSFQIVLQTTGWRVIFSALGLSPVQHLLMHCDNAEKMVPRGLTPEPKMIISLYWTSGSSLVAFSCKSGNVSNSVFKLLLSNLSAGTG